MNFQIHTQTIQLPDGREITLETGRLARQADGAVLLRMGNTAILATVVSNKDAKEGVDFLPLSVDYQEKYASSGKIPGSFMRREGRLSEYEILVSRLVDRAIRPLFPSDYHADTQIAITLLSLDPETSPDALAALAASAALTASDIPFQGPISEVRVTRSIETGTYFVNPTPAQSANSDLDLIVAASYDNIMMVEGELKEVSEEAMLEALKVAHDAIKTQCLAQKEFEAKVGKTEKRTYCHEKSDLDLYEMMKSHMYEGLYKVAASKLADKKLRKVGFSAVMDEFIASLPEDHTYDSFLMNQYFGKIKKKACRDAVLKERYRLDGRALTEVRDIDCQVDFLPSAHGSSLFTRGETQSVTTVTLGTKMDEQLIDNAVFSGTQKYLLHYNFPGFSTGEVKPNRGPGRREIGHGNLALRALRYSLPEEATYPYTIRIVSDILESNGSSSMATVCAGSLALMDAGIPMKGAVSGIAMGMISDSETGAYAILSDILGDEDHLGDMDFKVTGTSKGITACQMDIKVDGLSYDVLKEALLQAKQGREHILGVMNQAIQASNEDMKPHAPRCTTLIIERDQIGAVIGPGGKIIQEIQRVSGATVVIEEKNDKGHINIFASDGAAMNTAVKMIKDITAIPEIGTVYKGIVKTIMNFGAFIEFMKGKDGLLHISEIDWNRIESMDGIFQVGEEVEVKLVDIDKDGKFRLSRKVLLPQPEGYVAPVGGGPRGPREGGNSDRRPNDQNRNRGPRR